MAKHVIFLVHGMGEFAKGWSADIQKQIAAAYSTYAISKVLAFNDFYRFEEINYNQHFDKLRKKWRDDAKAVGAELKKGGLETSAVGKLTAAGGKAGTEDEFLSSHVLDVVLYRFVPMVAEAARTEVAKRILDTLVAAPALDPPRWSIVAHSLGTAVTHDALHALFTQGVKGQTLIGKTKADVVMMIANVSRLLEDPSVDVYKSVVRPSASPAEGICRYYVNARHEWDPIPIPKAFKPLDDWPDVPTRQEDRFRSVTINAFQHKNIHGFGHYLSNPKVHVALFNALVPMKAAIPDDEAKEASMKFEASTPFGQFEGLQQAIKKFQIAEESTWAQVIAAYTGFFETLKAF